MLKQDLIDFAQRSRVDLAEIDAAYWRERKQRYGEGEGLRIAEELRQQVLLVRPDWPTPEDRAADLAAHVQLSEQLRSVTEKPAR